MKLLFKHFVVYLFVMVTFVLEPTIAQNLPPEQGNYVNLKPAPFKKELANQKGIVLDVRTPAEYAKGHLPNAINLNYLDPGFKQAIKELKPNQPYFIYCAVGGRSAKACAQLKNTGLNKIYNLEGGITAWQQAGQIIIK